MVVRSGDVDGAAHVAFSTDGGSNWFAGSEPAGVTGGGTVAAAADGSRFVWSPGGAAVHYSVGYGNSWVAAGGVPAGAVVESDRVNPRRFYALAGGRVHSSVDGGVSFVGGASVAASKVHAVPGREGELWLAGEGGLFRSVDGGASATRVGGVSSAVDVGFGRAAPGRSYPALYAVLDLGDGVGVHRSDDVGSGWVRINDDRHRFGNMGEAITGGPRVYGRVYLGTNGRGILYADPVGAPPVTSTTSSSTTTTGGVAACRVDYRVSGQWAGGFTASVKITNRGVGAVRGWALRFSFAGGQTVTGAWNGKAAQSGALVTVTDEGWNGTIAAGGSVEFGFQASWQGSNVTPTGFTLNGGPCSVP